jgi:transglutaminase-like putative cysteine protease
MKNKKRTLYSFFSLILPLFVLIDRAIYETFFYTGSLFEAKNLDVISPYVGIIVGSLMLIQVIGYLIEVKQVKFLYVALIFAVLIALSISVPPFSTLVQWIWNIDLGTGDIANAKEYFVQGILVGFLYAPLAYGTLYLTKSWILLLVLYEVTILSNFYDANKEYYLAYFIFQLLIGIIISIAFMLKRHNVSVKELGARYWIYLIILSVIITGTFLYVPQWDQSISDRIEKLQEMQREQRQKRDAAKVPDEYIPIDKPVGRIDDGTPQPVPEVHIVGFYQAKQPLYLKFEILSVEQLSDRLHVTPKKHESFPESAYWANEYARGERSNASVVFAKFSDQYLLSPEGQAQYDIAEFTEDDGLLRKRADSLLKEESVSYSFDYLRYRDAEYQAEYSTYRPISYTYVSTDSERYSELVTLAYDITKDKNTAIEKAYAIRDYFHNTFTYTLNPGFTDKMNPIDDFILDMKQGYCLQYAVATSMLLDILDIESRVVGGYYSGEYVKDLDAYVIVGQQAHAWTEIYLTGYGWVTIDSTPGAGEDDSSPGVQLNEAEKQQVALKLKAINPAVSFDDIARLSNDILPDDLLTPETSVDFDETERRAKEAEKEREETENEKRAEDEKKKEEERQKKEQEKFEKTVSQILIGVVILSAVASAVALSLKRHVIIANFKRKRIFDQKRAVLDRIEKKLSQRDLSHKQLLLRRSVRDFSQKHRIIDYFAALDRILYAPKYSEEEYRQCLEIGREILNAR